MKPEGLSRKERAKQRQTLKRLRKDQTNIAVDAFIAELRRDYNEWEPTHYDRHDIKNALHWIVRWYGVDALKPALDAGLAIAFFSPRKERRPEDGYTEVSFRTGVPSLSPIQIPAWAALLPTRGSFGSPRVPKPDLGIILATAKQAAITNAIEAKSKG